MRDIISQYFWFDDSGARTKLDLWIEKGLITLVLPRRAAHSPWFWRQTTSVSVCQFLTVRPYTRHLGLCVC